MDLSAHNYGTGMLDMELTSSAHSGIMMLESRSEEPAEAPRAPQPPLGASGAMTRLSRRSHPSGQLKTRRRRHRANPARRGRPAAGLGLPLRAA